MVGRAVSDDEAEYRLNQQVFEKAAPATCGLLAFWPSPFPNGETDMTIAIATPPTHALMNITARPPNVFVRGEGSYLWDSQGKRYLDFVQGWAVNSLGHSPPVLTEALSKQAATLLTPSPAFYNDASLALAAALAANSCFDQVFFTNSGAEANEGAIKLARKYGTLHKGGAYEIICFDGGFHGRTLATMSASGKKAFEPLFEPKVPGFPKAQLN